MTGTPNVPLLGLQVLDRKTGLFVPAAERKLELPEYSRAAHWVVEGAKTYSVNEGSRKERRRNAGRCQCGAWNPLRGLPAGQCYRCGREIRRQVEAVA